MNTNEIINSMKHKYHSTKLDFQERDAQTGYVSEFMSLFLGEVRKNKHTVREKEFYPTFLKLFFGGIYLSKKREYIINLKFSKESEKKLIDYLNNLEKNIKNDDEDKFCLGLTGTNAQAANYPDSIHKNEVTGFIELLLNGENIEKIKPALIDMSGKRVHKFTPGIVSNILFAYNPKQFYVWNNKVSEKLKENFGFDLEIKDFMQYFENLDLFINIKKEFNLKDYGEVDSIITGFGMGSRTNPQSKQYNKNIILYGPPGTGKTFKTKEKAVGLIENV